MASSASIASIATVVGSLLVGPSVFAQPGPLPAADLARQGMDRYNAGDFAGAVASLQRAHEMEPHNFDYRFALAQALRESGDCGAAVPHYDALIDAAPHPEAAEEVRGAKARCATPQVTAPETPAPAESRVAVTTSSMRASDVAIVGGAGAALGAAACLFLAARSDRSDAEAARSYADHERIGARADRLYVGSAIAAGVGVGLAALAFYRIKVSRETDTTIAISPRADGGAVVLGGAW